MLTLRLSASSTLAGWLGLLTLLLVSAWAPNIFALPRITTPVTDQVGLLSQAERDAISARLLAHQQATGVQMAIVIVTTTGGVPIDDYALELATAWGGGDRDRDDGVVYVLAIQDRQMRLEVGYGLEDRIPDGAARALIDQTRPLLRSEQYSAAILAVVDGVVQRTADLTPATVLRKRRPPLLQIRSNYALTWSVGALIALLVTLFAEHRHQRRSLAGVKGSRKARRKALRKALVAAPFEFKRFALDFALAVFAAGLITYAINGSTSWLSYQAISAVAALCVLISAWTYRGARHEPTSTSGLICVIAILCFAVMPWGIDLWAASLDMTVALHLMSGLLTIWVVWGTSSSSSSSAFSSSSSNSSPSYSSSSSSYSSPSYSSSSSSSSSYGGGGGSFGGGGASSSW